MKYFSVITADHWMAKNNAHKQALIVAKEMSRRIIDESEISQFKKEFTEKINKVNSDNKRCADLELSIWKHGGKENDIHFTISGVFYLTLYQASNS